MGDAERLEKLERFYREVALLTLNHDVAPVLVPRNGVMVLDDVAVVYPAKLGPLLEEVDKEWWKPKG